MRKFIQIIVITIVMSALSSGCNSHNTQGRKTSVCVADSISKAALDIYDVQPRRALAIIDRAQSQELIPEHKAQYVRAVIYSRSNLDLQDSAMLIGEQLLVHDSVETSAEARQDVLEMLCNACRLRQDDENWLRYAIQLADLCHAQGDKAEALRTEAEIGVILTHLGRVEEGVSKLDRVIAQLKNVRQFNYLDASVIAMKRKINVLMEHDRCAEAIPLAESIIHSLEDYAAHPADYDDNSYRQPKDSLCRNDYIGFYRAQALGFMANAYAMLGDLAKAKQYVRQFEDTDYGQSQNGRAIITPTWMKLGDYGKVLGVCDETEKKLGRDTINPSYCSMVHDRAVIAYHRGQYPASQSYWQRYSNLLQLVHDSIKVATAQDYATRYHVREQQLLLDERQTQLSRQRIFMLVGTAVVLVLSVLLLILRKQHNTVKRKNAVLVQQISESAHYRTLYETLKTASRSSSQSVSQETTVTPAEVVTTPATGEMNDEELFRYISGIIVNQQLFADPDFSRQQLMDKFGLSAHQVGAAFSRGSAYHSLPDFVRACRLAHACRLLEDENMTISDVAKAAGFSNLSVFSRDFKNKYTISPTEYRRRLFP